LSESPQIFGYETVDEYYDAASSVNYIQSTPFPSNGESSRPLLTPCLFRRLYADVAVPTLILHAMDDPIVPAAALDRPREEAEKNPNTILATVPYGGMHLCAGRCALNLLIGGWPLLLLQDMSASPRAGCLLETSCPGLIAWWLSLFTPLWRRSKSVRAATLDKACAVSKPFPFYLFSLGAFSLLFVL
jgi:hypothetical protein